MKFDYVQFPRKSFFKCSKMRFWYSNFGKCPYRGRGYPQAPTPSPRSVASLPRMGHRLSPPPHRENKSTPMLTHTFPLGAPPPQCVDPRYATVPLFVVKVQILHFAGYFLSRDICPKKRNIIIATQASPVYPRDTLYGCQFQQYVTLWFQRGCVEEKYQISEWNVRTFIHCHFQTV